MADKIKFTKTVDFDHKTIQNLTLPDDIKLEKSQIIGLPDDLQNIREVAEGKCQTIVVNYSHNITSDMFIPANNIKTVDNQRLNSWADLVSYLQETTGETSQTDWRCRNEVFNSNADSVTASSGDFGSFIAEVDGAFTWIIRGWGQLDYKGLPGKPVGLKTGDIILVVQTNVPDRWINNGDAYKLETSKVDLSWSSIQNKPTNLVGFGLDDEVNNKIVNYTESACLSSQYTNVEASISKINNVDQIRGETAGLKLTTGSNENTIKLYYGTGTTFNNYIEDGYGLHYGYYKLPVEDGSTDSNRHILATQEYVNNSKIVPEIVIESLNIIKYGEKDGAKYITLANFTETQKLIFNNNSSQVIKLRFSDNVKTALELPVSFIYIKNNTTNTLSGYDIRQFEFDNSGFTYDNALTDNYIYMSSVGSGGALWQNDLGELFVTFAAVHTLDVTKANHLWGMDRNEFYRTSRKGLRHSIKFDIDGNNLYLYLVNTSGNELTKAEVINELKSNTGIIEVQYSDVHGYYDRMFYMLGNFCFIKEGDETQSTSITETQLNNATMQDFVIPNYATEEYVNSNKFKLYKHELEIEYDPTGETTIYIKVISPKSISYHLNTFFTDYENGIIVNAVVVHNDHCSNIIVTDAFNYEIVYCAIEQGMPTYKKINLSNGRVVLDTFTELKELN